MQTSNYLVFDIKRFAIHDGAGLRTTVFFKGCPLRCSWCQNPEGLSSKRRPIYFETNCIHCKMCSKFEGITYNERPYFDLSKEDFDQVIDMCPSSSIRYDSTYYSLDALVKRILEDKVFFQFDGGVTFSGGEPFNQGEKLIDLLKRCKEEGIHTAIETTLYAPLELIKKALPYLDIIYIDCKEFDEKRHEKFTGVSSKMIKEHIQYVLQSEHKDKVIIRTPLIPTMNATDENIRNISNFLYSLYPDVKYELLNYNPLASAKYPLVDLDYELGTELKMYSKEEMNHFYEILDSCGLKNIIKE